MDDGSGTLRIVNAGGRVPPTRSGLAALRFCMDPAGLPYSNDKKEGFEIQVSEIVANELGMKAVYTWWARRRGFLSNTLGAGRCDVVVGVPVGIDMRYTTLPYYRSTFAFVTRRARPLSDLNSFDDPRLRTLTIGVPLAGDDGANPGPLHALSRRGITNGLRGFPLYAELGRAMPAAAEALLKGDIDVAVLWGPVAGFAAKSSNEELVVNPVAEEVDGAMPLTFVIGLGVRKADAGLARRLGTALANQHAAITAVLRQAGVPLLPFSLAGTSEEATDALR
jgi:mxaJ protein